jgi:hypothetical protein
MTQNWNSKFAEIKLTGTLSRLKLNRVDISNSTLVLIALASAFFPRIIEAVGAPAIINFVHFAIVPVCVSIIFLSSRTRDQAQIKIVQDLLLGLMLFLIVMTASALLNEAGILNLTLNYILLAEPFLFLAAIVSIPLSGSTLKRLKNWILLFALINMVLAYAQYIMLKVGLLQAASMTLEDNVQGVFYVSGAGNYVSATVSPSFGLYFFLSARQAPLWARGGVLLLTLYQIILSDSKQILLSFMLAGLLLLVTKLKDIQKTLLYLIIFIVLGAAFYWCIQNLETFGAFKHWGNRIELYLPGGEGSKIKSAGIQIILSHYESLIHWFLGLGPAHTIGRMGGWSIREYWGLLAPFGATRHPSSLETWEVLNNSWLALESSLFSPLFSWAGLWGDLGLLGVAAYLHLSAIVRFQLCKDDFSQFMLYTIFILGFILTQPEEPGYMLSIAALLGIRWHELNSINRRRRKS